jgi:hypothetical protein
MKDLSFIEYGRANLPRLNSLVEKASLVWERKILMVFFEGDSLVQI